MKVADSSVLLAYFAGVGLFVLDVFFNQRAYQDSWILQDILVPTILFVLLFSIAASMIKDNRLLTLVCASFVIVLSAIPNLKYQYFYGTFDSVAHYGYLKDMLIQGHTSQTGFYASTYISFPGMYAFISSLSLVLGIPANAAIKLTTSLLPGIVPLMTYFVTNRSFDSRIQRYIIVASGLPTVVAYALGGTQFAVFLYFPILCVLFRMILTSQSRAAFVLFIVFWGGLLSSHAMTPLFTVLILGVTAIFLTVFRKIRGSETHKNTHRTIMGLFAICGISYIGVLSFDRGRIREIIIGAAITFFTHSSTATVVPKTFYQIPLQAEFTILMLNFVKEAVLVVLSFVGLFVLLKKLRVMNGKAIRGFYVLLLALLSAIILLLAFQVGLDFGEIGYNRLVIFAEVLSPFLSGLALWQISERLGNHRLRHIVMVLLLFSCISISLLEFFPYQPLVPKANVMSQDLPSNEPVVDLRSVNTVYQKDLILFAQSFCPSDAKIASDVVTRWQIYGFANDLFGARLIYSSPLGYNGTLKWDFLLLHYDGKAGPLNEKAEYRTQEAITSYKNTIMNNVVYDNGESFMIARAGVP